MRANARRRQEQKNVAEPAEDLAPLPDYLVELPDLVDRPSRVPVDDTVASDPVALRPPPWEDQGAQQ